MEARMQNRLSRCLTRASFSSVVGRGGRVITGLLPCIFVPLLLLFQPFQPTPPDISQWPAEFIYAIIMLSCHVSGAVSTPLLCLALVCQCTEGLPPAITAVKR